MRQNKGPAKDAGPSSSRVDQVIVFLLCLAILPALVAELLDHLTDWLLGF